MVMLISHESTWIPNYQFLVFGSLSPITCGFFGFFSGVVADLVAADGNRSCAVPAFDGLDALVVVTLAALVPASHVVPIRRDVPVNSIHVSTLAMCCTGWIRTIDQPRIRRVLYQAELRCSGSGADRSRTGDLWDMSPTSYQLLYSATPSYMTSSSRAQANFWSIRWPEGWLVFHSSRFSKRLSSRWPLTWWTFSCGRRSRPRCISIT